MERQCLRQNISERNWPYTRRRLRRNNLSPPEALFYLQHLRPKVNMLALEGQEFTEPEAGKRNAHEQAAERDRHLTEDFSNLLSRPHRFFRFTANGFVPVTNRRAADQIIILGQSEKSRAVRRQYCASSLVNNLASPHLVETLPQ